MSDKAVHIAYLLLSNVHISFCFLSFEFTSIYNDKNCLISHNYENEYIESVCILPIF